jgi:hypothetical protein
MRYNDMRPRRAVNDVLRRAGAPLALLATLAACGGPDDRRGKDDPGLAALRLFELARVEEPTDPQLRGALDRVPGENGRAALLDALAGLTPAEDPRVIEVVQPAGPEDAFVDLAAGLPGGGIAHFNLRLRLVAPGSWRVSWFRGPGVEWPPAVAGAGQGLSSSAPPEAAR